MSETPLTYPARGVSCEPLAQGLYAVTVVVSCDAFEFCAGQFVEIKPEGAAEGCTWSIASSPSDLPRLTFFVRALPGYEANERLLSAAKDQGPLQIGAPQGACVAERFPESCPLLAVAGGTGIAPIHALLLGGLRQEVHVYWGVGTEEELFLHRELTAMVGHMPNLRYFPVVERPTPNWQGRTGWVHEHALNDEIAQKASVLVSGSPAMVRQVRKDALARGVKSDRLFSDLLDLGLLDD